MRSFVLLVLTALQAILVAGLPRAQRASGLHVPLTRISSQSPRNPSSYVIGPPLLNYPPTTTNNNGDGARTVTLTALPETQTPTTTDGTKSAPDTTGSINTALNTTNIVSSQPFPTSLPTISTNTLQSISTTATEVPTLPPQTNTITIPVSTFSTLVSSTGVVSIPISRSIIATQVTVLNSTVTSGGSTFQSSSVGTTIVTTGVTVLSETTVTGVSTATGTISLTITATGSVTSLPSQSASCVLNSGCNGQNVFQPVAVVAPASVIPARGGHSAPRLGITDVGSPIGTNKFYANFFLGDQVSPVFTLPYSLSWSKGSGNAQSWGMSVSHIDDYQKVFGPQNAQIAGNPNSYYINPLGIQSIILSAAEMRSATVLTTSQLQTFSGMAHLQPNAGSASSITFPLVQGMSFVTGVYTNLQPSIQSSVFFQKVTAVTTSNPNIYKYRIVLDDGKTWLLYAIPSANLPPNFALVSSTLLQGIAGWSGTIQVAKLPDPSLESLYDAAAGAYASGGSVAGYASGTSAEYSLSWSKGGPYASNTTLMMFALPHHVASFSSSTAGHVTGLKLQTNTKGVATAVVGDYWSLTEDELPVSMGFAPWRPGSGSATTLSAAAVAAIQQIAPVEASQNMGQQSNLNSMYYSGKALSKFATIVYTMKDLIGQTELGNNALIELINAYSVFTNNQQQFPLLYDTDWKGIVSSASYVTGDPGADFGNSYYNDHHFHYGYFIHAAAIIGSYNATWLALNKDYINSLVRDVSNPSTLDQYFPVFRSFDWYHGHSWAKGLFESGDGKDQESSSEDVMFAYALKMWGKTTGDASMEARGNLMLAVLARSLQNYFLLESNNANQPASFVPNKVTGILFENKVDHTTYFGGNFEYIQGIHMLPLIPASQLTRNFNFVTQEWNVYFADGAPAQASNVVGGWKGVLYANLANINPVASWNFFSQANFDPSWLDGGASRTWYMALAAGLGGA